MASRDIASQVSDRHDGQIGGKASAGDRFEKVRAAFECAETIHPGYTREEHSTVACDVGDGRRKAGGLDDLHGQAPVADQVVSEPSLTVHVRAEQAAHRRVANCPIVPLGHKNGSYFFISASGELRSMKAEALEAGRGVRALFTGVSPDAEAWCLSEFATANDAWCPKAAGLWIIKSCNSAGVFDPNNADLRSIGVWRDEEDQAVAHCGDRLIWADGRSCSLAEHDGKAIMVGAAPIAAPAKTPVDPSELFELVKSLRSGWGWKRKLDPEIFFGWLAAAFLGGFPEWRAHLYVHGSRGSGKSKLMELAASAMHDLAGGVINDATETGLRQSRNNQARPVLIDEFEPDDNARNSARQDGMLALFRRMSGGAGGRISRGGADHSSVSFRSLGAAYVTSINHIHLEPQDRSRFIMLELGRLPEVEDPGQTAAALKELEGCVSRLAPAFFSRMLSQSQRWDVTHATIAAEARRIGADARQADTVATILAGRDLALFDGSVGQRRLHELGPFFEEMLGEASEADAASEGADALDYLLNAMLQLDHGYRRSVGEVLESLLTGSSVLGVDDPKATLSRIGVYLVENRDSVAVRVGTTTPVAKLFDETKWKKGAHASALLKLDGATKPSSAIRVSSKQQHRVILIPISSLPLSRDAENVVV